MTDIEIVRAAVELFVVNHFDSIEMSGTVKFEKQKEINYISINLTEIQWDENLDYLHSSLVKYLQEWAKKNASNFSNYITISILTIEYILPIKDGANQNKSKHVKLFYLPSNYYRLAKKAIQKTRPSYVLVFLRFWNNVLLRNAIVTLILTMGLIGIGIHKIQTDASFHPRLLQAFDYMHVASGIIASFVLGFLITKVITIRQDKYKYTKDIRELSNKLTYFRNICLNLLNIHTFWSRDKPFYTSFSHANSIKDFISYEDYHYPNYDDDIEYAKFRSHYNEEMTHSVVSLVLQLHMLGGDNMLYSGLTYTKFPPNYIYPHNEINDYLSFCDSNQIWYNCSESKLFPEEFPKSHYVNEIVQDVNRIYPTRNVDKLSRDLLSETSLDFQYNILPRLFRLTKVVDSNLPFSIRYFTVTFVLLMSFGLLIPTLTYVFVSQIYSLLSVFVVIGIIAHILLSLRSILEAENVLDKDDDYL